MPPAGVIIGTTVILHGIYSSYEFVSTSRLAGGSSGQLPKDVVAQLIIGLTLLVMSTLSNTVSQMSPLKMSNINIQHTLKAEEPYAYLETRPNFQDLVSKRQDYLNWRKTQSVEKK